MPSGWVMAFSVKALWLRDSNIISQDRLGEGQTPDNLSNVQTAPCRTV
jgi:hypothetical protein